ncbi:DNA polymerase III subunit gamma/tau [Alkalihalobacterium elongatum]|uniref:DNA polymerase III subunit gamma/tau n=1 Tax=Alkalihalobacterium elongatum TaxID=2675466 RepID=UPI001C1FB01E|nr:DNA polymerase III subunit gamma/tau [Alkalihalobacterium elongatum]
MGYQALYRVWRPQQLGDIAGQEHITQTLQNALVHNKFSHAYLFTGPRGTGKTSAAKIVAKAINCEKAPVPEPCNECKSCKGITDGSIVDVIEIDAASNNGVDEIRDIRDKVKFAPNEVRYKVYIIDEVHMLSTGAFNALLKTLEEPPKHVIFILATTEPHKIPLTIISRCQRFDFKRISNDALVARMKFIVSHYDTEVNDDALQMVARASDGGMRDALSLLDQAMSYSEGAVTLEDVLSITGAVSQNFLYEIVNAIQEKNSVQALKAVNLLLAEGKDPQRFIEDLIYYYRDILLYQTSPSLEAMLERARVDDSFKELAADISAPSIYEWLHQLSESQQAMKWATQGKIFLELAIVKLCQSSVPANTSAAIDDEKVAFLEKKLESLEKELKDLKSGQVVIPSAEKQRKEPSKPLQRKGSASIGNKGASPQVKEVLKKATKQDLQLVSSQWGQVMERVKQYSVPAQAWLSDCKPVAASNDNVILAFQNEMHRDMIETKFRSDVESVLTQVYQKQIGFFSILSIQWDKIKEDFLKEQRGDEDLSQSEADPIVDEAIKLVGSDLIEIVESK